MELQSLITRMPPPQPPTLHTGRTKTHPFEVPTIMDAPSNTTYSKDTHITLDKVGNHPRPQNAFASNTWGDLSRIGKLMVLAMTVLFGILVTFVAVQIWHIVETDNSISDLQTRINELTDSTENRFTDLLLSQGSNVNQSAFLGNVNTVKGRCDTIATYSSDLDDCLEYRDYGANISGLYYIRPSYGRSEGYCVYCDMDTDGGGWIVFQKRFDGSAYFFRDWDSYAEGFGDLKHEFWLGNDIIHTLTSSVSVNLRIDLWAWNGEYGYAEYVNFTMGANDFMYRLQYDAFLNGTAGDSLQRSKNLGFATYDHDYYNHKNPRRYRGAWWYYSTGYYANLNSIYNFDERAPTTGLGLVWNTWKGYTYSMKKTEMKFKRTV